MNKEEILQRSRQETKRNKGDELEIKNIDKSDHLSTSTIFCFILLLNVLDYLHIIQGSIQIGSKSCSLTGLLIFLMVSFVVVKVSSMYYYLKKKKYLVFAIAMLIVLILVIANILHELGVL